MKTLFFILLSLTASSIYAQEFPVDIQTRINSELGFLERSISTSSGSRSVEDLKQTAIASVFSSEAIRLAAAEAEISVTDEEAVTALLPLLTRNGLIDPFSNNGDWRSDQNVLRWLEAQDQSLEKFIAKGRDFALFMKLCRTQAGEISKSEVESYVAENPSLVELPDRIQLHFTKFSPPAGTSRSAQNLAVTGMQLGALRSASLEVELVDPPADVYDQISYWFPLQQLDAVLLEAVEGLKKGDEFGPVRLSNGALIAGEVKSVRSKASLPPTDALLTNILFSLATEKKGQDVFTNAANGLVNTRGFFGSVWNVAKKGFRYIAAAGGGVGGYLLGGPQGAMAGARLGWGVGGAIQSWYRNPQRVPQSVIPNWNAGHFINNYNGSRHFSQPAYGQGYQSQIPNYPQPNNLMNWTDPRTRIPAASPYERPAFQSIISRRPPSYHRGVPPVVMGIFY